jgi:hypothetical protein
MELTIVSYCFPVTFAFVFELSPKKALFVPKKIYITFALEIFLSDSPRSFLVVKRGHCDSALNLTVVCVCS